MRRPGIVLLTIIVATAITAASCSKSADTTAVESTPGRRDASAPTSTLVRASSTTTSPPTTAPVATPVSTDPTAALSTVVAALASDPTIAAQLQQLTQLSQLDPDQIAGVLGVDPSLLQQLQLGPAQLAQLAQGLASQPAGQSVPSDPSALLGLLMGSLDAESLLNGTVATLVQALLSAISGTTIVVSPDITVDMGEVLGELDPDGIGPIVATPANASLLALLTSAWLSENPLFAEQFLADPTLDPELRSLLLRLQRLTETIGDSARESLLEALNELFPGLTPAG